MLLIAIHLLYIPQGDKVKNPIFHDISKNRVKNLFFYNTYFYHSLAPKQSYKHTKVYVVGLSLFLAISAPPMLIIILVQNVYKLSDNQIVTIEYTSRK